MFVAIGIRLDEVNVISPPADTGSVACHDITAIGGLPDTVPKASSQGLAPLFIAIGVGLDEVDAVLAGAVTLGATRYYVSAVRGLLN